MKVNSGAAECGPTPNATTAVSGSFPHTPAWRRPSPLVYRDSVSGAGSLRGELLPCDRARAARPTLGTLSAGVICPTHRTSRRWHLGTSSVLVVHCRHDPE